MSAQPFSTLPTFVKQPPTPFTLHIPEQKLQDLKTLVKLSPIGKEAYESQDARQGQYGVSRNWMLKARSHWIDEFSWRDEEARINSFPNYTSLIKDDDGLEFTVHFAALFSRKKDAVPLALFHGWPGSFLEFLPILRILREKYTPDTLPFHVICPSLLGYPLSSAPPLDRNWEIKDTARVMHKLLLSLGFDKYVVQGGDIGSYVSRNMAATYAECAAMHLNFCIMPEPKSATSSSLPLTALEEKGMIRFREFMEFGLAYGRMHGSRPSTIGHVLSSSPLALLAWIGEKFKDWVDPEHPLPLDTILADVTLYWLTECFPTCIYTYREDFAVPPTPGYFHGQKNLYVSKPMGYSYFAWELAPVPRSWAETSGELVWFKAHERGGHFAALERPGELLRDIEDFVGVAWKG